MKAIKTALVLALMSACSVSSDSDPSNISCTGGKCDGPASQTCSDPKYGDGTCQLDLACDVPDIDCFETFADDTAAATWYATQEAAWVAPQKGKEPRSIIAQTDPRYRRVRDLLDRGWESFRVQRPVGELADVRPSLVVVDDPEPNAYVIPSDGSEHPARSAFNVIVQTGLLDVDASDDARLGVMMHELQHSVGLHVLGNTRESIKHHYVVDGSDEPLGRFQPDDPAVRDAMESWLGNASQIGPYSTSDLGAFPYGGDLGNVMNMLVATGQQHDAAACANAASLITSLATDIFNGVDPISGVLTADSSTFAARATSALAALRDECLPSFDHSLIEVVAAMNNKTPAEIEASISAEDLALITGKHPVDAMAALVADRRAKMRGIEASLPDGADWQNARFFTMEEDADDVSTFVMRAAGLDGTALGSFLVHAGGIADRCDAILATGDVPPYGVDLTDDHHSSCFRAYHINTINAHGSGSARMASVPAAPTAPGRAVSRLPMPHRIAID